MAALMLVLMVPVAMCVLMGMHPGLVAVFVPVVGMGAGLMAMLVLMLVFAMATHAAHLLF